MKIDHSECIKENSQLLYNCKDEYKGSTLEELRDITAADRLPYAVCCISLHGDLNVGAIIRTANILGAEETIIFGRRKYDARSTVGGENYYPVTKLGGLEEDSLELDERKLFDYFVEKKYFPIFVENTGSAISLSEIEWDMQTHKAWRNNQKPCFVFGNEGTGIPESLIENWYEGFGYPHGGFELSIPQLGVMRCLNVASAASIVLWDYVNKMGYL